METLPRTGLIVPSADKSDAVHPVAHMRAIAQSFNDQGVIFDQGIISERPAFGASGRFWYVDSGAGVGGLWYDTGTAWVLVPTGASSAQSAVLYARMTANQSTNVTDLVVPVAANATYSLAGGLQCGSGPGTLAITTPTGTNGWWGGTANVYHETPDTITEDFEDASYNFTFTKAPTTGNGFALRTNTAHSGTQSYGSVGSAGSTMWIATSLGYEEVTRVIKNGVTMATPTSGSWTNVNFDVVAGDSIEVSVTPGGNSHDVVIDDIVVTIGPAAGTSVAIAQAGALDGAYLHAHAEDGFTAVNGLVRTASTSGNLQLKMKADAASTVALDADSYLTLTRVA